MVRGTYKTAFISFYAGCSLLVLLSLAVVSPAFRMWFTRGLSALWLAWSPSGDQSHLFNRRQSGWTCSYENVHLTLRLSDSTYLRLIEETINLTFSHWSNWLTTSLATTLENLPGKCSTTIRMKDKDLKDSDVKLKGMIINPYRFSCLPSFRLNILCCHHFNGTAL